MEAAYEGLGRGQRVHGLELILMEAAYLTSSKWFFSRKHLEARLTLLSSTLMCLQSHPLLLPVPLKKLFFLMVVLILSSVFWI